MRYALITGASSGIGKEFAKAFAKQGYHLILVARREERLKALKKQLKEKYNNHIILETTDLSVEKQCYQLLEHTKQYPITVVVNCAGFGRVGMFANTSLSKDLDMIKVNITALHILTKLYARRMKEGTIINVASMAAFQPEPLLAVYGATKAYVLSLSRAVNYELKRQGKKVRILALCPGPVDTEFNQVAGVKFNLPSLSTKRCVAIAMRGLHRKREIVVPGVITKLLHVGTKLAPTKLVLPIQYRGQFIKIRR